MTNLTRLDKPQRQQRVGRIFSIVVMGAVVLSSAFLGLSVSPQAHADDPDQRVPLRSDSPARVWTGMPDDAINELGADIGKLVIAHEDVFTGTAYSEDYSTLEVYAKEGQMERARRLIAAAGIESGRIALVPRENSRMDLLGKQEELMKDLDARGVAWSHIAPDPYSDGLELGLISGDSQSELDELRRSLLGDVVAIELVSEQATAYSSHSDTLRFTMGSRLLGPSLCSAGYPVLLSNGVRGVVTAGHCADGAYENAGGASGPYLVGGRYISTWHTSSASTSAYGDWMILYGNVPPAQNPRNLPVIAGDPDKVERFIYQASNPALGLETDKILIGSMNMALAPQGAMMCISGQTSGYTCRYRVTTQDTSVILSDGSVSRTVGKITRVMRDDNNDGVGECTTVTGGDSGGSVLFEPGIGATSAMGYGIVTGGTGDTSCPYNPVTGQYYPKYIWVTRMQGLKAYDSGAAIGGFL